MTSANEIRKWVMHGKKIGATHVVIRADTFNYPMEDFPVYVMRGEDVNKIVSDTSNMQKTMEVYNLSMDIDMQLSERRAWNL